MVRLEREKDHGTVIVLILLWRVWCLEASRQFCDGHFVIFRPRRLTFPPVWGGVVQPGGRGVCQCVSGWAGHRQRSSLRWQRGVADTLEPSWGVFTPFFNVFCGGSKGSKVCMTRRKTSQRPSNASKNDGIRLRNKVEDNPTWLQRGRHSALPTRGRPLTVF